MRRLLSKHRRILAARVVLALLLFGAYVPTGFMPAAGAPFLVELCPAAAPLAVAPWPDSLSMPMAGHHHHPAGTHSSVDSCPFGSAPGAGPISHFAAPPPPAAAPPPLLVYTSAPCARRTERAHPPRGPPSPA